MQLVYGSCKLLDMLGYGSMIASDNIGKAAITQKYLGLDNLSDGVNPLVYASSQTVNALPFLAYQKVYFDFYSDSQWEKHLAYAYNVDYWTGSTSIALASDMLKLRYANYPKDYFMGILPNSQYGNVAALSGLYNPSGTSNSIVAVGNPNVDYIVNPAESNSSTVNNRYLYVNSDLSALLS